MSLASETQYEVGHIRTDRGRFADKGNMWFDVTHPDFGSGGAKGDGDADDTAAIQAAVEAAEADNNGVVFLPAGEYRVTGTITVKQGVMIVGAGSQGSTQGYGTSIVHESTSDLFVVNGNSATAAVGTGGGFKDLLILKADGFTGGDAIRIIGTDDDHRPGEMVLDNVSAFGAGSGKWARGLVIDGTANTTPGGKGIRTINIRKVRVASCTTDYEYVLIDQGTHVSALHLGVDTGTGTGAAGMTIAGDSENISLVACVVSGTMIVKDNATHVNIQGRVSVLDQQNESCLGTAIISSSSQIQNASVLFRVVSNQAPAWRGVTTATDANVTGDGTNYTVLYDSEDHDRNSNFNPATGVFTCTVAGTYDIHGVVLYTNLGSGHTRHDTTLVHKDSLGSTLHAVSAVTNPYAGSVSGNYSAEITAMLELAEGDTLELVANVSGSTKTVGVFGNGSTDYTWFEGRLVA